MRHRGVANFTAAVAATALLLAGIAQGETQKVGNMLVTVSAKLAPNTLPRTDRAPVAVSVGWKITSTDGSPPSTLKTVKIQINSNGILNATGLPTCPYSRIQPASTHRALSNCRASLVGTGTFAAQVGLEGQENYVAKGRMVVFNSVEHHKPVLYGQIYTGYPFAASFVIVFKVSKSRKGTFGTTLSATLPVSLRDWGNLTEVNMRLSRKFSYRGRRRSFLTASCPTPKGFGGAPFRLARTSFAFENGRRTTSTLTETCKVRH
jgi:hypothetical protein